MTSLRIHGGPDAHGAPLHDFSTNSNACGPCPAALLAINSADLTTYPDSSYSALRAQLAAFHGVAAERVVLAASGSEFIFRISSMVALRQSGTGQVTARVQVPLHGYGDYASAAHAHGLPVEQQELEPQLQLQAEPALRWHCSPSSPLGQDQVLLFCPQEARSTNVLDCAYQPLRLRLHSGPDAISPQQRKHLWQLFTPNKALGLTGVRAAYAIAPVQAGDVTRQLNDLCPSWPIGAHGVAMLRAWTSPSVQLWLTGSLEILREWKARQLALCESMGWATLPSDANFFCTMPALPPGLSLPEALARLRTQGIKLRDTTSFGMPGCVRLGVLAPAAQDALHKVWQHIVKGYQ